MSLYQIQAPHFCAGFEAKGDLVTNAAPIISYMVGWSLFKVKGYCKYKKWNLEDVTHSK